MRNGLIQLIDNSLFVSSEYLIEKGIPESTQKKWIERRRVIVVRQQKKTFYLYDEIPKPTAEKLPERTILTAIAKTNLKDNLADDYFDKLRTSLSKDFINFRNEYSSIEQLSSEQVIKCCQLHAVWHCILTLKSEQNQRELEALFTAFDRLYPNKYCNKFSFANAIKKAKSKGIKHVSLDKRLFSSPLNVKRTSDLTKYWTTGLISIGKKYSNREVWERLKKLCQESGLSAPSKSWVDKYRKQILKTNVAVYSARYGNTATIAKKMPFASMVHAHKSNEQWQVDGWTLPFWVDGYNRYVLVIVRDAYSKMIVGFSCGKSENTLTIMEAYKSAINTSGALPLEIVTDNHSFNKTKEAGYFRDETEKLGVTWTITSNPQHKSIIERYNQYLDSLCKEYRGYLGKGIQSKSDDSRPKQEYIDEAAKTQLSENEVKGIAALIVKEWNENGQGSGKSQLQKAVNGRGFENPSTDLLPNSAQLAQKSPKMTEKEGLNGLKYTSSLSPIDLYKQPETRSGIDLDVFDRIRLLTPKSGAKISRGQVTIKRGGVKFEYQLSSEQYVKLNERTVSVRYEDLSDCIYLYDSVTDEPLGTVYCKPEIHGSLANQTTEDKLLLFKNKGRIEGIKSKSKKHLEELTQKALKQNPEAILLLNKMTTPKSVAQELERDSSLKTYLAEADVRVDLVQGESPKSEIECKDLFQEKRQNNSPFAPKEHEIGIVSKNDSLNTHE